MSSLDPDVPEDRSLLRDLTEIRQRHDYFNYAGSEKAGNEPVAAEKRDATLKILADLQSSGES